MQRVLQLWCLLIRRIKDGFQRPVLVDEFCSCLFTDTRNTFKIVARISTQRRIVRILRWRHARSLKDACFVIQRIVANTTLVVQHANERVFHKLVAVTVSRNNNQLGALLFSVCCNSGN